MLNSPSPRPRRRDARACYWRDRVPSAQAPRQRPAIDEPARPPRSDPRRQLLPSTQAVEVASDGLKHPTDYYIDYTLGETIRQLEPQWRQAIAAALPSRRTILRASVLLER
jgi:hypothetical protein